MQKITWCCKSSKKDVRLISVRATSQNTDPTVKQCSYLKGICYLTDMTRLSMLI